MIKEILDKFKQQGKEVIAVMSLSGNNLFVVTCKEKDMMNNTYIYNALDCTIKKETMEADILDKLSVVYSWMK